MDRNNGDCKIYCMEKINKFTGGMIVLGAQPVFGIG